MKRRSFLSTVIGGAYALVWPWKVEADEVQVVSVPTEGRVYCDAPPPSAWVVVLENGPTQLDRADYVQITPDGKVHRCVKDEACGVALEQIRPGARGQVAMCDQLIWQNQGKANINRDTDRDS